MKHLVIIFAMVAGSFLVISPAMAVEKFEVSKKTEKNDKDKKRIFLKLNPAYLLVSELAMAIEVRTGKFTWGPVASYSPEHSIDSYDSDTSTSNLFYTNRRASRHSYGLQGKYYFRGPNRHSAYVGALAQYSNNKVKLTSGSVEYSGEQDFLEIGAMGGFQWKWSSFTLNVGGGLKNLDAQGDFKFRSSNGDTIDEEAFGSSLAALILDVGVGYSF